eukprot:3538372-Pyramimonas_sp.AAC.1
MQAWSMRTRCQGLVHRWNHQRRRSTKAERNGAKDNRRARVGGYKGGYGCAKGCPGGCVKRNSNG